MGTVLVCFPYNNEMSEARSRSFIKRKGLTYLNSGGRKSELGWLAICGEDTKLVIRGRGCHVTGKLHSEMGSRDWEEPGSLKTARCYRVDFRLFL